jgi:hypothetical protein
MWGFAAADVAALLQKGNRLNNLASLNIGCHTDPDNENRFLINPANTALATIWAIFLPGNRQANGRARHGSHRIVVHAIAVGAPRRSARTGR